MHPLSLSFAAFFIMAAVGQIAGIGLLPKTQGFTNIGYTLLALLMFTISFASMSRMLYSGVNLSSLVPILASIVPLSSIVVGVLLFGEIVTIPRACLLVIACCCVGLAARY